VTRSPTLLLSALASLAACGGSWDGSAPPLAEGGRPAISVVVPADASPGLRLAAEDLASALAAIAAPAAQPLPVVLGDPAAAPTRAVIHVEVLPASRGELGDEGHRMAPFEEGERHGLRVTAAGHAGAMHALYTIAADLGVRYLEPEQGVTLPALDPAARLPWSYRGQPVKPRFVVRGFHEHTQHPVPASDFFLRPEPELRPYASRYLRWLARNRQSFASFQMLKTVPLASWRPYIKELLAEAHGLHLRIGLVVSFVDEQQNNYKLVRAERAAPAEQQIEEELDAFVALGFDAITVQIGSSEFTKPDEKSALAWMNAAARALAPHRVPLYAWVHTLCTLKTAAGGYYYHLPLEADPAVGAWVHTTMLYTLEHPAPVYGCSDFKQQLAFLERADGKRPQVYFPETAWWLGFDNNLPLALPLTGWSRAHDLLAATARFALDGHVTFTTGREWGYWQYDHYLTRATWDGKLGWSEYLDELAPVFGEHGAALAGVLKEWTALQRRHLYEENPSIIFYLAGELPQDEMGEVAGILARSPKLAFGKLLDYDDAAFAAWKKKDYELLERMRGEHAALLARLPASAPGARGSPGQLYHETRETLHLYVRRIEHALELYAGVEAARGWARAPAPRDPALKASAEAAARVRLAKARAISDEVRKVVAAMEPGYRYPVELLSRKKPESLTSYPFGYLYETSSGLFWTRRDDQLALVIDRVFSDSTDAWTHKPELLFVTGPKLADLLQPASPIAATVIEGFTPTLLFGLYGDLVGGGAAGLVLAHDANRNLLPDTGTELDLAIDKAKKPWLASTPELALRLRSSSGELLGSGLTILGAKLALEVGPDPLNPSLTSLSRCTLDGEVASAQVIELVVGVSGIDKAGAESLVRSTFGVPAGSPTPERLPIQMALGFERAQL
jgi:hypothetical protein